MAMITGDTSVTREFTGNWKAVTEERVFAFSGGFPDDPGWPKKNIHTDLEFARSCGLPTRAASGAMFEGYLAELMTELFGEQWLRGGTMTLSFIATVDCGDRLLPHAVVRSKEPNGSVVRFTVDVWCENQHGTKVVVGTAQGSIE